MYSILILTSHGGGALRYEGTILNVTEPRASLCMDGWIGGKKEMLQIIYSIYSNYFITTITTGK